MGSVGDLLLFATMASGGYKLDASSLHESLRVGP